MEVYILKSAACLGILFLFYKLVLENTSLHTTKRFFLLGSLAVSFVIPFITFTEYIEVTPVVTETFIQIPITISEPTEAIATPINYLPYIWGGIYVLGVLIFSVRFGRNMLRIFNKVRRNPKHKNKSIFHVLLKLPVTPHSFFNYIFFSKKEYEAGEIPQEVLVHETAHVEQKHSWDIVFFELLRIVFWFNPLLYFIKHSIKLNHEFLADRTVLNQGAELSTYQTILLDFSSTSSVPQMAHSINYSSTRLTELFSKNSFGQVKKRFTVMKTHTSKRAAWLKGLLVLPLLAVLIYGFSETKEEFITFENPETVSSSSKILDISINEKNEILIDNTTIQVSDIEALVTEKYFTNAALHVSGNANVMIAKSVVAELVRLDVSKCLSVTSAVSGNGDILSEEDFNEIMSPLRDLFQKNTIEQASPKQLEIYNKLAKKYNAVPVAERKIGWEDLMKLENIYRQMSEKQRQNALPFPECLPKNQSSWEEGYAKEYNDGAARNNKKSIVITINVSEIMINGKTTSLKNFAKELDKATKDWTTAEYQAAHPSVLVAGTPDSFMEKLDIEFRKTAYFKANGGESIIPTSPPPPPPAPDAINVIKSINDHDPNIPPPPPAPKVLKGINDGDPNIPPPPPPPTSPLNHIIEMAKKNATFYFEGKQITSDKAIELVKKNKDLNIQTTGSSSKNPQVKISTKPITFDSNKKMGTVVEKKQREAPKPTAGNVVSHLKVMNRHGATFYLNGSEITFNEALKIVRKDLRQGFNLDVSSDTTKNETYINGNKEQAKATLKMTLFDASNLGPQTVSQDPKAVLEVMIKQGAKLFLNSDVISKEKALALIKKHKNIEIITYETPHDIPSIVFSKS